MKAASVSVRSAGWLESRRLSSVMLVAGAVLLVALVVGLIGYLFVQDVFAFGKFPAGVKVVGVSVAGLNQEEAVSTLKQELAGVANKPLTLKVDDEKYEIPPEQLGLMLDYRKMVNAAYEKAWSVSIFERMFRRFTNRPKATSVSIIADSNPEQVQAYLSNIINSINRHPHDAYVDPTSGVPVIVPEETGRSCPMEWLREDVDKALVTPDRTVNVRVGRTPAGVTQGVFNKFILITINEHKLQLYERDKVIAQFPVACGSASWPTPAGAWKVTQKQRNPSWTNPGSSWASSMPKYIAPGPGNPLGTRALATSASGVLIHGTPSSWSIGSNVSHGCIRMYMRDIEQLFEMVETNTPIYIIKAPGDPGYDVRRKPEWN